MSTAIEQNQKEFERQRLNRNIEEFVKAYTPQDPHDAARFHAHLHSIVRDVYADMATPVNKALEAVLYAASPSFIIKPEASK